MSDRFVGIVCGLRSELRCLERSGLGARICAAAAGADPRRAETLALDFARRGAAGLISFGMAGGLTGTVDRGDLVLPSSVVSSSGEAWCADRDWFAGLLEGTRSNDLRHHDGTLLGVEQLVATPEAKRELHERTGAVAVDMESHAVARAAASAALPLLVIRAIADPVARAVPPSALSAVACDGGVRPFAVAARVLGRPSDVPQLARLWRDSAIAHATLRRAARDLLPAFLGRL